MPEPAEPLTLGVKEAAELVGCGARAIRAACASGALAHTDFGGSVGVRIRREALEAWLLAREGSTDAQ